MMESAIEISSGTSSGSGSDDEVSEAIRQQVRLRKNPSWLYGSTSIQAKARPANPASHYGAPRDSKRSIVNSRTSTVPCGVDYEQKFPPSQQQSLRRTLPPSFNTTSLLPRSATNSISHGTAGRVGADYSTSLAVSNKSAFGDRHRGAHTEIGIHRGMNGVRILPPSLTHGTSASPLHYGGPSDPMHRLGVGDDRNSENDERLIYQAALQVNSLFYYECAFNTIALLL